MPEQPSEEEMKAMQEKMKNMSPEELKELQKQQCIFCQIVDGKVASKKVYEDDICLAILDINPANPGHVLLMPKEHFPLMPLMPEDIIGHLFIVSKHLARVMLTALNAEGTDIFVANGSAAGQRAQHFMLHIIPRKTGDEIKLDIPVKDLPKKKVDEVRKEIESRINAIFKLKKEVKEDSKAAQPEAEKEPAEKPKVKEDVSLDDIAKLVS